MLLLNFSHPLTREQLAHIETITGQPIQRAINAMPQFNEQQPFEPQLAALLDQIELTPEQWQTEPILIVLPALNFIAAALLADLHGRMGYFPHVVRTRPVEGSIPRRFEVAEILDLQALRAAARRARTANH
ncbi:MAG: CRISPR-associated protein Csx15 [Caldilineaceae bacterium]|nr:CRISPR-associated protein Csx15 [Caldilineaceae bacterium]